MALNRAFSGLVCLWILASLISGCSTTRNGALAPLPVTEAATDIEEKESERTFFPTGQAFGTPVPTTTQIVLEPPSAAEGLFPTHAPQAEVEVEATQPIELPATATSTPEAKFESPQPRSTVEPEERLVQVVWPPMMRLGESDVVKLALVPTGLSYLLVTEFPGQREITHTLTLKPYEGFELFAAARLDGVSFRVSPQEELIQFLPPGEPVEWRWSISPSSPGSQRLAVILSLKWVPVSSGTPVRVVTAFSTSLEVQVVSFLGLTRPQALLGGLLGLFFGASVSLFSVVFHPKSKQARHRIRDQSPNPTLDIDLPAGLSLAVQEQALMRSLFRRYGRLAVKQEFSSGYSGARTFLVLPVHSDGRSDAYTIAKLGEKRSITREFANYETYVKDRLPPITARIQHAPVQLPSGTRRLYLDDPIQLAALQYTFIGSPGASPVSLKSYLEQHLDPGILFTLFDSFSTGWWLQRKPYSFRWRQEYDRVLPAHYVIEPAAGNGRQLSGSQNVASQKFEVGETVTLHDFKYREQRVDRKSLSLTGESNIGAIHLRVRWLSSADPEGASGRIVATRRSLLDSYVNGFQLHGMTEPLDRLPQLLDTMVSGSISVIHGDLNLENLLVGPGGMLWMIDFAQTREGHTLFDFAHLEAELIAHLVASRISSPAEYYAFMVDPEASKHQELVDLINTIRKIAYRCLFNPAEPLEYQKALAITCLGALKYANITQHARNLLYLTAAFLMQ